MLGKHLNSVYVPTVCMHEIDDSMRFISSDYICFSSISSMIQIYHIYDGQINEHMQLGCLLVMISQPSCTTAQIHQSYTPTYSKKMNTAVHACMEIGERTVYTYKVKRGE